MTFTEAQIQRYARHILLPEVGGIGQQRLFAARVLVIGAGGLGSPLLLYLAAAGVGTIGVVDDDRVDLSNLQRQILHDTAAIDHLKVDSAAARLHAINPEINLVRHPERMTTEAAAGLIADYDLVADGSDNFATRYLLNDVCHALGKTLVSAALLRFDGQLSTFKPYLGAGHPCYRCLYPEPPPAGTIPSCAEAGVFGALAGTMGSLQTVEVLKELLDIGETLSGTLLLYDALATRFSRIGFKKRPDCPTCSGKLSRSETDGRF